MIEPKKSIFSLLGFLAGLALLLTGFIIAICTFPEKIWFLGLAFLIPGFILAILDARYFVGIADKEIKNKKGGKKGKKMRLLKRILNQRYGGWFPSRIGTPNNGVRRFVKRNEERKKNIDSLKESIKKMKKYKRKA